MKKSRSVLWLIICLCFSVSANGQLMTVRNASIICIDSAIAYINGDINLESGSTLRNDGYIYIKGDWINNAADNCLGNSSGSIMLNGNAQQIGGQNSTTFPELIFQGTGIKTLQQNISIGNTAFGTLNLANSILNLNSNSLTLNNSSSIALIDSGGYIISEKVDFSSKVIWNIQKSQGNYTIPFATVSGEKIPVIIQNNTHNIGVVTFSTYATASNNLPLPQQPTEVTHIRNENGNDNSAYAADRYWFIYKSGNEDIESLCFKVTPSELPLSGNGNLSAQLWNPLIDGWNLELPSQLNPDAFTVTIPSISETGIWALASTSSPLPVELLYFDAKPTLQNTVLLNWITASEKSNDYFIIERSNDGVHFEYLQKIKGAGNTTIQQSYQWEDLYPFDGISYYRLKQTDFNGDFSYSPVKAVQLNGSDADVILFPNPGKHRIYFTVYSTESDNFLLQVYDAGGKMVRSMQLHPINTNQHSGIIDRNELNSGIYIYHLLQEDKIIKSGKFVFD